METAYIKHAFELNKKAITDMTKIFGPNTLSRSKATRVFFSPKDDKAINVEYICHPTIRLMFEFKGDDRVIVYGEDMKKIACCSVYDSHGQTAKERVQQMVMDAFDRKIFLD